MHVPQSERCRILLTLDDWLEEDGAAKQLTVLTAILLDAVMVGVLADGDAVAVATTTAKIHAAWAADLRVRFEDAMVEIVG
mmetsp:Transcript_6040/g.8265  ORF Transcript_6040/g.8265 Transcript_6040/m.8265 type:complete len:81 (-) Transcript_6040:147-389(-)